MARRRERYGDLYEGDFGLSGLTARVCASPDPRPDLPAVLRLAVDVAGECEGEGAVELGNDLALLRGSGVGEDSLRAVWLAAVDGRFDPADHGLGMGDWLERLAEHHPPRVRAETGGWGGGTRPEADEGRLRREVVAEIRTAGAEAQQVPTGFPGRALESLATESDADLALRLLLRVLKARGVPVGKQQFDRLMALDERLAYPGPLVYDGLTVRWPPVDPDRRDSEGDFGLTALATRFAGPWHALTPGEVLDGAVADDEAGQTPGSAAAVLLRDALRLLESPVPTGTITAVWDAASERGYDIERAGGDGRDWLRTVAAACRDHLAQVAPAYEPRTVPAGSELADAVLDLLRESAPELARGTVSPHDRPLTGPEAAEAVARVVADVDPDLGFRLLVRLLSVLAVPLPEERYARFRALGARFGLGARHVSEALERLVRRG
ncbi:hypothetical protein ACFCWY_28095 [Streptomyces sp. NPDC056362]|uniref:hypothetical protein n=1 Tax=unclassified Streptomyces TaxID=2593676 RepID=UPI0035D95BC2